MNQQRIVTEEQWLEARKQHLAKEKELTRQLDSLREERRNLPWTKVAKPYRFHALEGELALADLFEGRSQLVVQHFMFGPGWQEGCVGCSFGADHVDAALVHLRNHDVSFAAVSRAPLAEIEAFRKRMGWRFRWVSSNGSDFNYDYHVSFHKDEIASGKVYYNYALSDIDSDELPGLSVFYKGEEGDVFHTYSTYARGGELLGRGATTSSTLRPRDAMKPARGSTCTDWVRHHDRYGDGGHVDSTGRYVPDEDSGCGCEQGTRDLAMRGTHADRWIHLHQRFRGRTCTGSLHVLLRVGATRRRWAVAFFETMCVPVAIQWFATGARSPRTDCQGRRRNPRPPLPERLRSELALTFSTSWRRESTWRASTRPETTSFARAMARLKSELGMARAMPRSRQYARQRTPRTAVFQYHAQRAVSCRWVKRRRQSPNR